MLGSGKWEDGYRRSDPLLSWLRPAIDQSEPWSFVALSQFNASELIGSVHNFSYVLEGLRA